MKTVVITGGTGGIGLQTAIGIASKDKDYRVIITGRNQQRGDDAVQRIIKAASNDHIELVVGDVSSFKGVDELAKKLLDKTKDTGIAILINNAGYLGDEMKTTEDGLETHFAINVASPWRLTHALLPALKKAEKARVVNVTGGEEKPGPIDIDNLQAEKGFRGLMTYGHSKSVSESMGMALSERLKADGITVNVVFPGQASTSMTGQLSFSHLPGPMKLFYPIMWLMFRDDGGKSAAKAAISSIYAATDANLEGVTGKFYNSKAKEHKLHNTAYDSNVQQKIVALIENAKRE